MVKKRQYKKGTKGNEYDGKTRSGKTRGFSQKGDSKRRALRNNANRAAKRAGTIKKGQEVDHKVPLRRGGSNSPSNRRVVSRRTNRKKG